MVAPMWASTGLELMDFSNKSLSRRIFFENYDVSLFI